MELKKGDIVLARYRESGIEVSVITHILVENSMFVEVQSLKTPQLIRYHFREEILRIITRKDNPEYFI